jgi:Protein of unknown function (DUF3891)
MRPATGWTQEEDMILNPIREQQDVPASATTVPIWKAIERWQAATTDAWWLVTQPDHAALSGVLAARFRSPQFPRLDAEVVDGIGLHDEGWATVDGGGRSVLPVSSPKLDGQGRPLSFMQVGPADFVPVWDKSIAAAESGSAIAGILVSWHFTRIGQMRPVSRPEDQQLLQGFLRREEERRARLMPRQNRSAQEIETLIDVLQFCDLLSLYLCAGVPDDVELPQKFNGKQIVLRRMGEVCRLDSSPFVEEVQLSVPARRWPGAEASRLDFLVR